MSLAEDSRKPAPGFLQTLSHAIFHLLILLCILPLLINHSHEHSSWAGILALRYGLANKFIHACCRILWKTSKELFGQFFSDSVFWTKPEVTHSFYPFRSPARFWVAISSLLIPVLLFWSLWILQEQRNFISRGDHSSKIFVMSGLLWNLALKSICCMCLWNATGSFGQ